MSNISMIRDELFLLLWYFCVLQEGGWQSCRGEGQAKPWMHKPVCVVRHLFHDRSCSISYLWSELLCCCFCYILHSHASPVLEKNLCSFPLLLTNNMSVMKTVSPEQLDSKWSQSLSSICLKAYMNKMFIRNSFGISKYVNFKWAN